MLDQITVGQNGEQREYVKVYRGKPARLGGSMIRKITVEMERGDRFKRYLKSQITELGDGLDMGMMNDFWFLVCISGWRQRLVTEKGNIGESPGN